MVPLRFIRKGLYEISTNSRVRLPYNHGKKSWDKFVFVHFFTHTHTRTPPPPPAQTHQTNSRSRMNLHLLSPSPLPTMWASLHQRMLERVALLVQTSVVKYIQ